MRRNPKQEVLPKALEDLKTKIWRLPYLDRISLLAMSVIADQKEAYAASSGLIVLASGMAKGYSVENRLRLAELLRTQADILDHELQENHRTVYDVSQRD